MRPPPVGSVRVSLCLCLTVFLHRVSAAGSEDAVYKAENNRNRLKGVLEHIQSYEVTSPVWLHPRRHTRSANKEHPAEVQVLISAEGQQLRIHLEKNEQLLAPGYQEIWFSPDGARRSASPASTENCFYHGEVLGIEGSSVAVSTCSGIRGLISLNESVSYLVEPLPDSTDAQQHAVFRAESLRLPEGSCTHHYGDEEHRGALNDFIRGTVSPRIGREKRELMQNMKYVELLLVADRAEFERHDRSLDKTKQKLLGAANLVDKYYKALNIRVALIGLEVWTDQDKIGVSDNPHSTLAAFLSWRRKELKNLPNDNAQLVTGVSFQGSTIGLAPLKTMCSEYQSGGVNTDHSPQFVGVAATIAHEMGHNFGMNHDRDGCCQAKAEDGGCIMAAATGSPFPRVFNPCNLKELKSYLNSGGGKCLFNLPNINSLYGGRRCGNGYLESGEECDCGEEEECTSPCCNANNCTLKAGAECAHGVCCHNCKIKSPGELCRGTSGLCDLPEYCDGKSESCPANFYLADGTTCAHGRAYCYTGMCLTLEQQCQFLWGRDARPSPDVCFKEVNKAGDMYGNCGKDQEGKYRRCRDRDAKCGKIQCSASAAKPIENNAVRIETTVKVDSKRTEYKCLGTHVYKLGQGDEEPQGDTLDPGLVMTGTKCADNSICFNGECRNASFLRADECNAKCHGHGLCNNNHNCHCDPGWAPPWCNQSGPGGSLDSGPPRNPGVLLPSVLILVLLVVLATFGLWFCYKRRLGPLKAFPPLPVPKCSEAAEDKPMETDSHVIGHANPTFLAKQDLSTPHPSPSCSGRPKQAIVRPAVKPPPIPVYAAEHKDIRKKPPAPFPPAARPPQKQTSPQGHTQPLFKAAQDAGQRPSQTSPIFPGPPSLLSQNPKIQVRPDPPKRPPPPCPINRQSADHHIVHVKRLQSANKVLRRNDALAPSAGQKMSNRV
ncbi:disintegrin and metalloproteinase domain-containing protein 19 isoform X1 [Xiphophorus hellerii]|uniref:disintegrin and metalloproteinase domain-containing protein 19 isoform X1 n=2 Tax=Xiphophorus hellerii TaxID=8084 RepID=UPI0013B40821|nr:disintegrin and metalloproteinase domain-containing protein 19 isoform X1 [Xiphophorus hellerii]